MGSFTVKEKRETRAGRVLAAFALVLAILIVNIARLSVVGYEYYSERAFDQITTTATLTAERGCIYGANMELLATTRTSWRIFVSTRELRKRIKSDGIAYDELIAAGLSEILGLEKNGLLKKIQSTSVLDVTVKRSVSEEDYRRVLDFITKNSLSDLVMTEAQTSRYYPEGSLAAHVLGFTGSDNQGLYGLEYQYNSTLAGKDGYYLYAKDANGNAMPGDYSAYVAAEDGQSIVTTIDVFVQRELEAVIEKARVNHSAGNRVTGIVMDTRTGAILGMATTGAFDPNDPFTLDDLSAERLAECGYDEGSEEYKAYKAELLRVMWSNKAISETYEPGSTFKIVTVSAALDSGAAKITDTFSCGGYHTVGGWKIKCHKVTGHGSGFDLGYGLQMSCNPTMMKVAERMGAETFYSYVKNYGYLEKTGIDLPGEAGTIFHSPDAIGATELATASFGQRFKVSIINQLTAISAVANGGVLVEPYLVEKILDKNGSTVWEHETIERRRVISEDVARLVSDVLEKGVSGEGGAKNACVTGYPVAAKTGTSQKFDILDANGASYLRIGSTVAYAPVGESGISVIIVVDEPQSTVKYGSVVAAPYISELLSSVLPYLGYDSSEERITARVDNYIGMNPESVKKLLSDEKISVKVIGSGNTVISQSPTPMEIRTSGDLTVYLYTESQEETVRVPSFVGMTLGEASTAALNAGLNISIFGVDDMAAKLPRVTAQSLAAESTVRRGTVIELTVLITDFED